MVGANVGIEWHYCEKTRRKHMGEGVSTVRINAAQKKDCLEAEIVQDL